MIIMLFAMGICYIIYQLFRNSAVYKIRTNWINTNDKRYNKYSYKFMNNPNKNNWFGLRYPKDKHYK